ncbi:MAG: YdeI/OmpD-associated family protein [Pseudomonadota bacterium]
MPTEEPQPELFANAADWTAWLKKNHASSTGVWLRIARKDAALVSLTIQQALDGALCYGWIDGQRKSLDGESYLQRYTPRAKRSPWSKINRDRVAALMASRKMRAPGLREIERAKEDGRWDAAYASQKNMEVPDDLLAALAKKPRAKAFFGQLDSRNRYAVLLRLHSAKKSETRARRLENFVAMLDRQETLHPPAKKKAATKKAALAA